MDSDRNGWPIFLCFPVGQKVKSVYFFNIIKHVFFTNEFPITCVLWQRICLSNTIWLIYGQLNGYNMIYIYYWYNVGIINYVYYLLCLVFHIILYYEYHMNFLFCFMNLIIVVRYQHIYKKFCVHILCKLNAHNTWQDFLIFVILSSCFHKNRL